MKVDVIGVVVDSLKKLLKNNNIFIFALIWAIISAIGSFFISSQAQSLVTLFRSTQLISVLLPALIAFISSFGILLLVFALVGLFVTAMIMVAVNSKNAGIDAIIKKAASRYITLLFTTIVAGIIVLVGLILLIIPGIFLAIKLSIADVEAVVGKKDVVESLKSSWRKTSGNFWRILAAFIVMFFVVVIITGILNGIFSILKVSFLSSFFSTFFGFSFTIMTVLIYQALSRPGTKGRKRKT